LYSTFCAVRLHSHFFFFDDKEDEDEEVFFLVAVERFFLVAVEVFRFPAVDFLRRMIRRFGLGDAEVARFLLTVLGLDAERGFLRGRITKPKPPPASAGMPPSASDGIADEGKFASGEDDDMFSSVRERYVDVYNTAGDKKI
jgi:hypothetical protein